MTPSMKDVSRLWIRVRMKAISLRVFSKIILGSSDSQRKQFGAITIAKLFTSIFVIAAFSSAAKTWNGNKCSLNLGMIFNQVLALKLSKKLDRLPPDREKVTCQVTVTKITAHDPAPMLVIRAWCHYSRTLRYKLDTYVVKILVFRVRCCPGRIMWMEPQDKLPAGIWWGRTEPFGWCTADSARYSQLLPRPGSCLCTVHRTPLESAVRTTRDTTIWVKTQVCEDQDSLSVESTGHSAPSRHSLRQYHQEPCYVNKRMQFT